MGPGDARPVAEWNLTGNYVDGYEQALREGLRDNQDASIMDYGQGFNNEPYLGRYDYAAIKYAYGDVVETFNSPNLDTERAQLLRPGALHYTYIPEVISNGATYEDRIAAMYDRGHVNYRKTDKSDEMYDASIVEVPYVFCSDEYRNAAANCATWDQGVDTYERVTKHIEDYRSYHVFDAFKRQRVVFGLDVFSYLSRLYGRRFYQLANQYKQWVNDELIIRADAPCVFYEEGVRVETDNHSFDEQCGLEGFIASANAINFFSEVIGTPDVGCYVRLEDGCYEGGATNDFGIDGTPITKVSDDQNSNRARVSMGSSLHRGTQLLQACLQAALACACLDFQEHGDPVAGLKNAIELAKPDNVSVAQVHLLPPEDSEPGCRKP